MEYRLQIPKKTFEALNKLDKPKKEEIIKVFNKILKDPFSFKPLRLNSRDFIERGWANTGLFSE